MKITDYMNKQFITVNPEEKGEKVAGLLLEDSNNYIFVTSEEKELLGIITRYDFLKFIARGMDFSKILSRDLMTPRDKLITVTPRNRMEKAAGILAMREISQIPVLENGKATGVLNWESCISYSKACTDNTCSQLEYYKKAKLLLSSMHEGMIEVDSSYIIREFNKGAENISGLKASERIGKKCHIYMEAGSPVSKVLETRQPLYNVEVMGKNGKTYLTNNVPVIEEGKVKSVLQTIIDITEIKDMQNKLVDMKEEIDKAFALTLPNSKVENKLKNTPEYTDIYDKETGLIKITGVIPDGSYRHVVNCLKFAADLNEKGMLSLIGIDKDTLVKVIIFHDIAKSQPDLQEGDVVNPKEVFLPGHIHAEMSADIAEKYYDLPEDVVTLIRYHHHEGKDLPPGFPKYLLPLLRLFQVIDGASAGLTRRKAKIEFKVKHSTLIIFEKNIHPDYNNIYKINLFTGQKQLLDWPKDSRDTELMLGELKADRWEQEITQ